LLIVPPLKLRIIKNILLLNGFGKEVICKQLAAIIEGNVSIYKGHTDFYELGY